MLPPGWKVEVVADPPFPYGVAVVTTPDGAESAVIRGDDPVMWEFINAIAAAPKLAGESE